MQRHESKGYLQVVALFGLWPRGRGFHPQLDAVAEGVAEHQLCVALKELCSRFQLRQELLVEAVAHQLTFWAQVPLG